MESIYTKQDDGTYSIEVDGMVDKSQLKEFRDNNTKLNKELEKIKSEHKKFTDSQEEDRIKREGSIDELRAHWKKETDTLLLAKDSEISTLKAEGDSFKIDNVITAYSAKNVSTALQSGFETLLRNKIDNTTGSPVINSLPLGEYLEKARESGEWDAYLVADDNGGAGTQSSQTLGSPQSLKTKTPEDTLGMMTSGLTEREDEG